MMKLKKKPSKPTRKNINRSEEVWSGDTLAELLVRTEGVDPSNVRFDWDFWGDNQYNLCWKEKESDEAFDKRLKAYAKKVADYNKWYKENKEEILAEEARREDKKKEKASKEIERRQKQINKLQEELNKLKS